MIKASCDRKTRFYKTQKNTFGLLPGLEGTCPGATTGTGGCWHKAPGRKTCVCYVDSLMRCYTGIRGILTHNTKVLYDCQGTDNEYDQMVELLNAEFERFRAAEARRSKKTGTPPHTYYRLHWAGDVFDKTYAKAIATAVKHNSDINFWIYTRSFDILPQLVGVVNLAVYLSLDPVNVQTGLVAFEEATRIIEDYGLKHNIQICYMNHENDFDKHKDRAVTILEGRNQIRKLLGEPTRDLSWITDMQLRTCPVDTGKLELESGCANCKKCLHAKVPIWFRS